MAAPKVPANEQAPHKRVEVPCQFQPPPELSKVEMALRASELCLVKDLPRKDAAKALGVSRATISRLLKYARERGLVQIMLSPPPNLLFARQLSDQLRKYSVGEVFVAGSGRQHVGQFTGSLFRSRVQRNDVVVLDGGLTIGQFVDALPFGLCPGLRLVPLCSDPPSYQFSSEELVTALKTKSFEAVCYKLPPSTVSPLLRRIHTRIANVAREARFVFLGVGPFTPNHTAFTFVEHFGLEPKKMRAKQDRVAAVCGYFAIDETGNQVFLEEVEKLFTRSLTFATLKKLAATSRCSSVLLAHSAEKCGAVLCAIRARLCNTLIIDEPLAHALLDALRDRPA